MRLVRLLPSELLSSEVALESLRHQPSQILGDLNIARLSLTFNQTLSKTLRAFMTPTGLWRGWYLKRSSLVNENPSPAKKSFDAFQFMNIQIVAGINRPRLLGRK
jgi:hypothetical protein